MHRIHDRINSYKKASAKKVFEELMRKRFTERGVEADLSTFHIPVSTEIYPGTNLHITSVAGLSMLGYD